MLTLTDIRNITFRKASIGGYRSEEVDNFIDQVIASYELLLRESEQTSKKLEAATEKLEEYRGREDNISAALMNAQRQADLVIREANHHAEVIVQDAKDQSARMVASAQQEIDREEAALQGLKTEISSFKARLLNIYKQHLTLIDALPEEEAPQQPAEDARPESPEAEIVPPAEEAVVVPEVPSASETDGEPVQAAESAFFDASDFSPQSVVSAPAEEKTEPIHGFTVDLNAFAEEGESIAEEEAYERIPSRFESLKFGDDYDLNSDADDELPFAKFKRKK